MDATTAHKALSMLTVIVYAVAFPVNGILLAAYVKYRRELLIHTIDHLFVLIIAFHLIWCTSFVATGAYASINATITGQPASLTSVLCQMTGVISLETAGNAITTHVLIALERLLTVVVGVKDTARGIIVGVASVEVVFVIMAVIQVTSPRQFEPSEANLICFFPFVVPSGSSYAPLAGTIFAVVYCSLVAVVILGSYTYLYVVVIRSSRRVAADNMTDESDDVKGAAQAMTKAAREHERRVFYRCLGVVCVFMGVYLPEFGSIAYKLAANAHVQPGVDAMASGLAVFDTVLTPIMIAVMNRKVAEAAASVLGLRWVFKRFDRRRVQPAHAVTRLRLREEDKTPHLAAPAMDRLSTLSSLGVAGVALSLLHNPIAVSLCVSVLAGTITHAAIPLVSAAFVRHGRCGKDLLKPEKPVIAESMGVIAGIVYLGAMFVFIPVPFMSWFRDSSFVGENNAIESFPHDLLGQYLSGLLTLFSMLFLGFADDVLDIRWRVKIWMPVIAVIPLLMVYYVTYNGTHMVVPVPLRAMLGDVKIYDLGFFYYLYMIALAIFSTNAINIIAGVNGVEGAQILIIALSLALNSLLQILRADFATTRESHRISLYFLAPLIGVTWGYLRHNWYPAKVFGGDTLVYFGGMAFAVVGILGRFSKTVVLFMAPQAFNFLYSCPQLFGYNVETKLIEPTRVSLLQTGMLGLLMIRFLELLGLVSVTRDPRSGRLLDCNNLTLINLVLVWGGPATEEAVAWRVAAVQVGWSVVGFGLRYGLPYLLY
ncbi:tunicamycin resistance protein [Irineochytrium annulatum]|nr:tunicamycin resistance protein [Irineochytrium annulatum]